MFLLSFAKSICVLRWISSIECFHITSQRPCWCPKTKKWRPCWCPKLNLWELNQWSREWKRSISVAPNSSRMVWRSHTKARIIRLKEKTDLRAHYRLPWASEVFLTRHEKSRIGENDLRPDPKPAQEKPLAPRVTIDRLIPSAALTHCALTDLWLLFFSCLVMLMIFYCCDGCDYFKYCKLQWVVDNSRWSISSYDEESSHQ